MEKGGAHKILPLCEIYVQLVVVGRVKGIFFQWYSQCLNAHGPVENPSTFLETTLVKLVGSKKKQTIWKTEEDK